MKHKAHRLIVILVLVDILATNLAWIAAYLLRFHSKPFMSLVPVTKGTPPFTHYALLLPLLAFLWPIVLYFHGLYQIKRGRSRIDEFIAILFSVLISAGLCVGFTLYVRVYHRYQPSVSPQWEFSQVVFLIFIVLDVVALVLGRAALRRYLHRKWAAGEGVERALVAGTGELGQNVARTLIAHRELGYRLVGFLDGGDAKELLGLPVLGRLADVREVVQRHAVGQLYVALPIDEHGAMLTIIKDLRNECIDIKVVPDLLQYASMKATLEDLDGIPIISLNDIPLRGWNSMAKRLFDIILSIVFLLFFTLPVPLFPLIALLIKIKGGKGPIFFRQERMSLDGKTFQIFKFRSMHHDAEKDTGPVWAADEDPRRTCVGVWLRRHNLDELPQLINVLLGDMSLIGPRPERPPFVRRFKERIPQYMLRHRVKSGMTGWAQVNGWRGNTSVEKRIEFDLYYIENWSLLLDFKILLLTALRGFGQRHAY
ncbi:MAG: undecaprenyl-phosphate glucose phosphotransferase [Vicinamibacteria bacterium]|nr:undecaprenyl-phosphate glucose phosphotransferase [Vicinamibacteria bacterium]